MSRFSNRQHKHHSNSDQFFSLLNSFNLKYNLECISLVNLFGKVKGELMRF